MRYIAMRGDQGFPVTSAERPPRSTPRAANSVSSFLFPMRLSVGFFILNIAELCKGSTADSDSVCLGSNPSSAANKKRTFVYQKFSFCLSKPQAWHIITTQSCISSAPLGLYLITRQRASCLRLDDIQHFVLMIYRNKLRMIYKAAP